MSSFPTNFDWTTVNLCQSIFDRSDDSTAIKFMQLAPEVFPQFINETNHHQVRIPLPPAPATQSRTMSGSTTHHTHVSDTDTTQSNETVLAEDEFKAAQSLFNLIMLQHASNQHKHQTRKMHHMHKHDVNHKHCIMHSKHQQHHQPPPPHSHHQHHHPHPKPHLKTMTMMPMPMMMTNLSPTAIANANASKQVSLSSFDHHDHNGHHHHHHHHVNHAMNAVHAMKRRRHDDEEEEEEEDANEWMELEMQHMMEELTDECAHSMMRSVKFVAHSRAFVQCFESLDGTCMASRSTSTSISPSTLSGVVPLVRTPKSQSLNATASHSISMDEERPHACRYCEKRFETRAALNKHHNTHSGYRKFACKVCGRRYVQKWRWERHEPQCTLEMQCN